MALNSPTRVPAGWFSAMVRDVFECRSLGKLFVYCKAKRNPIDEFCKSTEKLSRFADSNSIAELFHPPPFIILPTVLPYSIWLQMLVLVRSVYSLVTSVAPLVRGFTQDHEPDTPGVSVLEFVPVA